MTPQPPAETAPYPLRADASRSGSLAMLVTHFPGVPVVARYVHHRERRRRCWVCEWGIFRGRDLRAHSDDEGAWMVEGDTLGPIERGTRRYKVVILHDRPVEREIAP